jgi:hypothetical protein
VTGLGTNSTGDATPARFDPPAFAFVPRLAALMMSAAYTLSVQRFRKTLTSGKHTFSATP